MKKQIWWELLDEEEIKALKEHYPDYKNYESPTLDMRWIIDSFNEFRFLKKKEKNKQSKS